MGPADNLATQRRIAASYDLALKALGIEGDPLGPNLTESQAVLGVIRRASTMMSMSLVDLYVAESKLRGRKPSDELITEFAQKVPGALTQQLIHRRGTPVEELLKALIDATTPRGKR